MNSPDQDARDYEMLNREIEHFIKRWEPPHPEEARRFSAELTMLIRRSAIDANSHILRVYAQVAALQPPAPIIFPQPYVRPTVSDIDFGETK